MSIEREQSELADCDAQLADRDAKLAEWHALIARYDRTIVLRAAKPAS